MTQGIVSKMGSQIRKQGALATSRAADDGQLVMQAQKLAKRDATTLVLLGIGQVPVSPGGIALHVLGQRFDILATQGVKAAQTQRHKDV